MPTLTRRRSTKCQDCWQVFYGDVCVGTIARRAGVPIDADKWGWNCGFYPGTDPVEGASGTATTFDEARVAFKLAWRAFLPTKTEADFQGWRAQRDRTSWKYAMWDAGLKMPTQCAEGKSRCFCGSEIDIASTDQHIREAHSGRVAA